MLKIQRSSKAHSLKSKEAGSAIVELAISLPLIMLIFAGLAGFSSLSKAYLSMAQSARSGALAVNALTSITSSYQGGAYQGCVIQAYAGIAQGNCAKVVIAERSRLVMQSHSVNDSEYFQVNTTQDAASGLVTVSLSSRLTTGLLSWFGGLNLRLQETSALKEVPNN